VKSIAILALLCAPALVVSEPACKTAPSVPEPVLSGAASSAYLAEQLACVDEAGTKSQADTCRAAVKARWSDGGAR